MTLDAKQVGEAMKQARVLAGVSITELAEASGVVETSVRSYEAGRMLPGLWNLCRIADALGVGLDELVGRRTESSEARLRVLLYAMRETAERIALVTGTAMENLDEHKL